MLQPVYLNSPGVVRVTLEGPALRIHSRHEADRFLPLARLARIVSRGRIQWSTAALLQCLQTGVPVTFLDSEGRAVGLCISAWPHYSPLNELLEGVVASPEGPARLVDWFRSQSRCRLLKLLRRHRLDPPDLRIRTVRRYLRQGWRQRHDTPEPVTPLKPLLLAQLVEVLTSYRIDPSLLEAGPGWAGLAAYLGGVLEWELWRLALNGRLADADTPRRRVAAYQRHADLLDTRMRQLVGQLWRWLEQEGPIS
ncbi:hypothetical protein MIN45_P1324 [Methylomarinovum tepidoasis]|uniref:Uncharacterized protein n=1 Tax=Methylomarinovum tepidoasis TaxID=2840183 RepID=A0AAU9C6V1_9GAMM|nr:CRISPR-associated endonuclease Cas1 [Methylomarinovum sp. IN45]BCX88954.1 hypothetical protein MIN45_P1324 [Methylomarinovum sp. IN45]